VVATPGVARHYNLAMGDELDGLTAGKLDDWVGAWFDELAPVWPAEASLPPRVLPEQVRAWCEQEGVDPEEPGSGAIAIRCSSTRSGR